MSSPANELTPARSGSMAYLTLVCLVATLGGLLFGYDTAVISGAIGFLQQHFQLNPTMVGWAAASALVGCAIGVTLAGPLSDGSRLKQVLVAWAICLGLFLVRLPLCDRGEVFRLIPDRLDLDVALSLDGMVHLMSMAVELIFLLAVISAVGKTAALFVSGRKKVLILSAILFLISAIGTAMPRTFAEFVIYRIIGGIGVGAASMTSPLYIAEISPARIRGRMVSVNQLAIVSGILLVYFVNYLIAGLGDESWGISLGWRWMFGSEALPALVLLALLFFVPESPRWLTGIGRDEEAGRILTRVNGPQAASRELAEIREALAQETGSLTELLGRGMRRALAIGIALAVLQQITGINVVLYYGPEILKGIAGARIDTALLQTILVGVVMVAFTVVAIWTVDLVGRKPLMILGAAGMGLTLLALGAAAYRGQMGGWLLIFMLGYIACFAMAVGPVTWVILSELFPTRIRGQAMAIATFCLWVANFAVSQTFPMMNSHPWLVEHFHNAFPFWVYAAFCVVLVLVMWLAVPETKGKTLEEIERHWLERKP